MINNDKRVPFREVFNENSDGSLTPKRQIFVNGVSFGPGVVFQKGVAFGGVDFHLYKYWDISGREEDGVLVVDGFYQP